MLANKAAIKARVVNRIADLAFTVGVLAIFVYFQSIEFSVVFALTVFIKEVKVLVRTYRTTPITRIDLLLFLGARGKSAQIGLHT